MLRVLLRSLFALVVAAAAVLVGWRVLAPTEVLATVEPPYPAAATVWPHVSGETPVAPLIVDDRVRVYASKRQVHADAPVGAETIYTAIWSFRRWPHQLSGVVAAGRTVISRWSDGALVAIDGITGKIVWRVAGPSAPGFAGGRTAAGTVWSPKGLRVSGDSVLVTAGGQIIAYEASTGARRWTAATACADGFTTAGGLLVCSSGAFDAATGTLVGSFPPGPYAAVGCDVASSACAGLRDGSGHGWLTTGRTPVRSIPLDQAGATAAAGLVFVPSGSLLRAVDPVSGAVRHDYPAAQVLGVSAGRVVLLTADRTLRVVDPRTVIEFPLVYETDGGVKWAPGRWQVTDQYVAVERLDYSFSVNAVIIAEL